MLLLSPNCRLSLANIATAPESRTDACFICWVKTLRNDPMIEDVIAPALPVAVEECANRIVLADRYQPLNQTSNPQLRFDNCEIPRNGAWRERSLFRNALRNDLTRLISITYGNGGGEGDSNARHCRNPSIFAKLFEKSILTIRTIPHKSRGLHT
jgi:hypothetical protein